MQSKFLTIPDVTMANGRAAHHIWRAEEKEEEEGKDARTATPHLYHRRDTNMGENMRIDRNNGADEPTYG